MKNEWSVNEHELFDNCEQRSAQNDGNNFHTVLFLTTCGADVHHKENLCELFQYVDFLSFHLLSVKF